MAAPFEYDSRVHRLLRCFVKWEFLKRVSMSNNTGRYALFKQFIADGIKFMFGNPGSTESGFLDALTEFPEITYILGLHESTAIGMADAYSRATKKPTLVQLHAAAGVGNGIGMLYQAFRGNAPLVIIAGSAGLKYDAMDGLLAGDLVSMVKPVTKWASKVVSHKSLLRELRRAIKMASTPPMGPTFLELPMDILDMPNDEEIVPTSILITRTVPDKEYVERAADILLQASEPLCIIGDGIAASGAQKEFAKVAKLIGAKVYGGNCSEVNMSAANPQFMGLLGFNNGKDSKPIISSADAVLICGTRIMPELFPSLDNIFAKDSQVIQIGLNTYEMAKNFPVNLGIVSDPKLTFKMLAETIEKKMTDEDRRWSEDRIKMIEKEKNEAHEEALKADELVKNAISLYPSVFMKELSTMIPEDTVIFDEALSSTSALNRYIPAKIPGDFFQLRGGVLGAGISGAVGLKIANPDKTVIGFAGDGASMFTIHALWTASHYHIGAKFVICNNRSYKLLKINMQRYWKTLHIPEHKFPKPFELNSPYLNFVKLSESMGVPAIRIDKQKDIKPGIQKMLETDSPFLIDLIIEDKLAEHEPHCKCEG